MEQKLITPDLTCFPEIFHPLLTGCPVFDSSCSKEAKVYFIPREQGLFLKTAAKGRLAREAAMTNYFHSKGLGAQVLAYKSLDADWLLTEQIRGEDCTSSLYLEDPKRLSQTTGELLRMLHSIDPIACPVSNRTAEYLSTVRTNYLEKKYDLTLFPDNWGYASPEDAWKVVEENGNYLKADTLLHGDYCLPNVILDNWSFRGFIDLDSGGVGDRHVDLFWGIWTLFFNLKTNAYQDRFLDAYGRETINMDLLQVVAACEVFG